MNMYEYVHVSTKPYASVEDGNILYPRKVGNAAHTHTVQGLKERNVLKVNNRTRGLFYVCIFLLAFRIELHLLQFLLINIPYMFLFSVYNASTN
jgi:hypothetical protein